MNIYLILLAVFILFMGGERAVRFVQSRLATQKGYRQEQRERNLQSWVDLGAAKGNSN
jgi:hypothetical protein